MTLCLPCCLTACLVFVDSPTALLNASLHHQKVRSGPSSLPVATQEYSSAQALFSPQNISLPSCFQLKIVTTTCWLAVRDEKCPVKSFGETGAFYKAIITISRVSLSVWSNFKTFKNFLLNCILNHHRNPPGHFLPLLGSNLELFQS